MTFYLSTHQLVDIWTVSTFLRFCLFIFREGKEGRKREKHRCIHERHISWVRLACPKLGTRPETQACALTGKQTLQPSGLQASTEATKSHQPGLHFLTIMNYECCCEYFYISFCVDINFISLGYIPQSTITGSYSNSMINLQRDFKVFSTVATPFYNRSRSA